MSLRSFGFSEDLFHQKFRDIAIQCPGSFDQPRLHEIQTLNRKMTGPDHNGAGQKLWLPEQMPVEEDPALPARVRKLS